jgi:hypothetical protein
MDGKASGAGVEPPSPLITAQLRWYSVYCVDYNRHNYWCEIDGRYLKDKK